MDHESWQLAGLTDLTWGLNAYGAQTMILVPPKVELQEAGAVVYPVPKEWRENPVLGNPLWLAGGEWWIRENHAGLLDDLLKLAEADIKPESIARFTKKWGPLWLCGNSKHQDCFWRPNKIHRGLSPLPGGSCLWTPREKVTEIQSKARQVSAALDAAAKLKQDNSVPASTWEAMGQDAVIAQFDISQQRMFLAGSINEQMSRLGNTVLWLSWSGEKPRLDFATGLGFLAAAWTHIAQDLCGVHGAFPCSGCGRFYVRKKRKPRAGQGNYCPECAEGYRASKREWARKGRARKA